MKTTLQSKKEELMVKAVRFFMRLAVLLFLGAVTVRVILSGCFLLDEWILVAVGIVVAILWAALLIMIAIEFVLLFSAFRDYRKARKMGEYPNLRMRLGK